jgi:hypothetical protein
MSNVEDVSMVKARLEIANQRVKDLEAQIARNIIYPAILPIYADCRWGMREVLAQRMGIVS